MPGPRTGGTTTAATATDARWELPSGTARPTSADQTPLAALVERLLAGDVPPGHLLLQTVSAD